LSRFGVPFLPYCWSKWSANDVMFLLDFFIEVLCFEFFCHFYFVLRYLLRFLLKAIC
jgi:hypothetical protein